MKRAGQSLHQPEGRETELTQETKGCVAQTHPQPGDHRYVAPDVNRDIARVVNRREQRVPIMKRNHPPVVGKGWGNIANGSQSRLNDVALAERDAQKYVFVRPSP